MGKALHQTYNWKIQELHTNPSSTDEGRSKVTVSIFHLKFLIEENSTFSSSFRVTDVPTTHSQFCKSINKQLELSLYRAFIKPLLSLYWTFLEPMLSLYHTLTAPVQVELVLELSWSSTQYWEYWLSISYGPRTLPRKREKSSYRSYTLQLFFTTAMIFPSVLCIDNDFHNDFVTKIVVKIILMCEGLLWNSKILSCLTK